MTYLRLGDLVEQPDVAYLRHVCDCRRNTVPPVPELPSVTSLRWDEMTWDEGKNEQPLRPTYGVDVLVAGILCYLCQRCRALLYSDEMR